MFCSNCGNKLGDGDSFCPSCGAKIKSNIDIKPVDNSAFFDQPYRQNNKKKAKIWPFILAGVVVIAAIIVVIIVASKPRGYSDDYIGRTIQSEYTSSRDKYEEQVDSYGFVPGGDEGEALYVALVDAFICLEGEDAEGVGNTCGCVGEWF